jgi:hypothetical protein
MWFQPLIYFSAVLWAIFFAGYGIYALGRRAPVPLADRVAGFVSALVIAGVGAGVIIGAFYLVREVI